MVDTIKNHPMKNNIFDTALIFEGGGMRASYTAGVVNVLLENELYFDYVAGISAGASHSVNYLSRDILRSKRCFTDIVKDANFGGKRYMLSGKGYFNAHWIYEQIGLPTGILPFDFDKFQSNPAKMRIGSLERQSGKVVYWKNEEMRNLTDLMQKVRTSSTIPFFMPPIAIGGKVYVDGGLAGGIALDIAKAEGYKKFFIVRTRTKAYRKEPLKHEKLLKLYFRKYPEMLRAMLKRYEKYNAVLDEIDELEQAGKAYVFTPKTMPVDSMERNYDKLIKSYEAGYRQAQDELPRWIQFLNR